MKRSCVLCLAIRNTENVFKVVDGAFHRGAYFISRIPMLGATNRAGIKAKVLFRVNINHSTAGRTGAGIFTMTDTSVFPVVTFTP